jgi:hypothetical protein
VARRHALPRSAPNALDSDFELTAKLAIATLYDRRIPIDYGISFGSPTLLGRTSLKGRLHAPMVHPLNRYFRGNGT